MRNRRFIKAVKTSTGYTNEDGSLLSCILHFNAEGVYIGQEQMNCMDNDPPSLFFTPSGNEADWLSLTAEEMDSAILDIGRDYQ